MVSLGLTVDIGFLSPPFLHPFLCSLSLGFAGFGWTANGLAWIALVTNPAPERSVERVNKKRWDGSHRRSVFGEVSIKEVGLQTQRVDWIREVVMVDFHLRFAGFWIKVEHKFATDDLMDFFTPCPHFLLLFGSCCAIFGPLSTISLSWRPRLCVNGDHQKVLPATHISDARSG